MCPIFFHTNALTSTTCGVIKFMHHALLICLYTERSQERFRGSLYLSVTVYKYSHMLLIVIVMKVCRLCKYTEYSTLIGFCVLLFDKKSSKQGCDKVCNTSSN